MTGRTRTVAYQYAEITGSYARCSIWLIGATLSQFLRVTNKWRPKPQSLLILCMGEWWTSRAAAVNAEAGARCDYCRT